MSFPLDKEYTICPGCGCQYGHHNTLVDIETEECSTCCKKMNYQNTNLILAKDFISIKLSEI